MQKKLDILSVAVFMAATLFLYSRGRAPVLNRIHPTKFLFHAISLAFFCADHTLFLAEYSIFFAEKLELPSPDK